MVPDSQLPQIRLSQSQKEVVPQRGFPQVSEPSIVQPPPIPWVQKRFRKLVWAFTSIVLFIILVVVLVVLLLKLQRSGKNDASSGPSGVENFTNPSVGPPTPDGLSNGSSNFQLRPIFTDAINNTGLATITYMNNSIPQSSIFYVGSNGYIQEKRNYAALTTWNHGTINTIALRAVITPLGDSINEDPQDNIWDSLRMAAAYSADFYGGPQARLFYHSQADDGTRFLQEMIWTHSDDSWRYGATLTSPSANSHLAVTVDSATQTLRLFYSAGNLTLQESWLNISQADATWQTGITIPNMLAYNDANIAVVAFDGSVLIYYYALPVGGAVSIRELNLTGLPGSASYQNLASFNAQSVPVVSQPQLSTNGVPCRYCPIGATVSTLTTSEPQIYVFWAEQNKSPDSGYGALKTVSRYMGVGWVSSSVGVGIGQVTLPIQGE
ncbi:MAG: hypothetical protein Q9187_005440 [Circinaria calcarea]